MKNMINTSNSNDLHEFYRDKIDDMIDQKIKLNVMHMRKTHINLL